MQSVMYRVEAKNLINRCFGFNHYQLSLPICHSAPAHICIMYVLPPIYVRLIALIEKYLSKAGAKLIKK